MLLLSTMAVVKFRAFAFAALVMIVVVTLTALHLANGISKVLISPSILWKPDSTDSFLATGNATLGVSNYLATSSYVES